ncbi:hypothetical protein R3P38DRAFT_2898854 [Favolaschia claudopus]|uniref:Uncharacterized protein n=1 Tax=Favolaschia claudopus TaxID=2862362 RepID=A0AAW0CLA8_9AGAR
MTIPSSQIIDLATPLHLRDELGIQKQVRDRLEWTWGLGHDHLDEHLQQFRDPQGLLTNENVLMFPHNRIIKELSSRDTGTFGIRRPYIQKLYNGCTSFDYLVLSLDPSPTSPPNLLTSVLPPHLALCTTYGKILKAWGLLPGDDWNTRCASLAERVDNAIPDDWPQFKLWQLTMMRHIYDVWSWTDWVPPAFLSADSDQTMVEPEEEESLSPKRKSTKIDWDALSSVSHREPKRRLLRHELESGAASANALDRDESMSEDSHFTGIEGDTEAFVKASAERGDYEVDHEELKTIQDWAAGASEAEIGDASPIDEEIDDGWQEQPRFIASLDLDTPDYLLRSRALS